MTESEILLALAQATAGGEGKTTTELVEESGFGPDKVRKWLRAAVKSGQMRPTRKTVIGMHGSAVVVPSYVVTKQ